VAQRLIGGASSMREACNVPWVDPTTNEEWSLPSADTLRRLLWQHPAANHKVFEARTAALLHQLDSVQEAMDDASNDFATCPVTGKLVSNNAAIRRLEIKTRHLHYMLSKLLPQFQERYQVEHQGSVEIQDQRLADVISQGLPPLHRLKWEPDKADAYERWCEQRGLEVGNQLQEFDQVWKARVEKIIEGEYQEVDRGPVCDDSDEGFEQSPRRADSPNGTGGRRDEEAVESTAAIPSKASAPSKPTTRRNKPKRQQTDLSAYRGVDQPTPGNLMPEPEENY
jgi:hypothetical protein